MIQTSKGIVYYQDESKVKYFFFMDYVNIANGVANSSLTFNSTKNYCSTINVNSKKRYYRNCWDKGMVEGYKEFVQSTIRTNFALWMMVILGLGFFLWTIMATRVTTFPDSLDNNIMTLHPIYSVWSYGNEDFTKNARLNIL